MIDNLGSTSFNIAYLTIIWAVCILVWIRKPAVRSAQWRWAFTAFLLLATVNAYFGMAMIPKTIAYLIILGYFVKGVFLKKH